MISSGGKSIRDIIKYIGYAFWVGIESVVFCGVPRLIVFPVAAFLLSTEEFGLFIFSLSIVMMLGKAPAGGLETGILRHMMDFEESKRDALISTGIRLCRIAMLAIMGAGLVALCIVRQLWQIDVKIIWCLVPLLLLLYCWNLFELQMVRYRIERKFALRALWYGFLGLLMFTAIPGAILGGAVGMAWGFMLSYGLLYVVLSLRQKVLLRNVSYDVKFGKLLKGVWFHDSVASVLALSGTYIYRIILGGFHSKEHVAVFFGATAIVALSLMPVQIMSSLLMSMLGGLGRLGDLRKKQRYMIFGSAILIALVATLATYFMGPYILSVIFPKFANESAEIIKLIIMVVPCTIVACFSMPFITKFGPIQFLPLLNLTSFVTHFVPALLLIPRSGMKGAVISYNMGYGMMAVWRLCALAWVLKKGGRKE